MLWQTLVLAVLASFAVTRVLTRAHVAAWLRSGFRRAASLLPDQLRRHLVLMVELDGRKSLMEPDGDEPAGSTVYGYDFISCPLCVGFYVSGAVTLLYGLPISCWIPCYGAAYLLDNLSE